MLLGDICDWISKANSVSTFQLALLNNDVDDACSNLYIGQDLCLGTDTYDCKETYTVVDNDTCDGIIESNSLNSTALYQNNPQINVDCSNIYIGEVLCVANDAFAYPNIVEVTTEESTTYLANANAYEDLPWCE
ncbi:Chitinase [Phaffia rhodozyma]|uniref:Chitinase n=1 Tax=Phaffia rhodozyma TaxID=264483 RepID=A0A0F7SQG0_PHARH|nr:Chitinase [Phaffia rhodozyma]